MESAGCFDLIFELRKGFLLSLLFIVLKAEAKEQYFELIEV